MDYIAYYFLIVGFVASEAVNLLPKHPRFKRWEGNVDMGDNSNMFRGVAGVDYPDFKSIPQTSFRCDDQAYEGHYADVEAQCQVYHVCHDGRKESFLCGKGTLFNQQIMACDYWYSTECENAPSFYYLNSEIGQNKGSWDAQQNKGSWGPQQNKGSWDPQQNKGSWDPQQNKGSWDAQQNKGLPNRDYDLPIDARSQQRSSNLNNPRNEYRGSQGDQSNVNSNQNGDQKPCCCLKDSRSRSWDFPAKSNSK